eukprot:4938770-Pyramimonas_sp.AAC.1
MAPKMPRDAKAPRRPQVAKELAQGGLEEPKSFKHIRTIDDVWRLAFPLRAAPRGLKTAPRWPK